MILPLQGVCLDVVALSPRALPWARWCCPFGALCGASLGPGFPPLLPQILIAERPPRFHVYTFGRSATFDGGDGRSQLRSHSRREEKLVIILPSRQFAEVKDVALGVVLSAGRPPLGDLSKGAQVVFHNVSMQNHEQGAESPLHRAEGLENLIVSFHFASEVVIAFLDVPRVAVPPPARQFAQYFHFL